MKNSLSEKFCFEHLRKFLASLLLFSLVSFRLFAASPGYFYYGPEGKNQFELNLEKALIQFSPGISFREKAEVLAKSGLFKPLTKEMEMPAPKVVIAEFSKQLDEKNLLSVLQELKRLPVIIYANPFLTHRDGTLEAAQDRLAVKLFNNEDRSILENYAKNLLLNIEETYALDKRVVFLRVSKNSPGNALEIANQLAETKKFQFAEPDMFRLMKRLNTNDPDLSKQWSLNNTGSSAQYNGVNAGGIAGADMRVFSAWGISTGSSSIKVAIVDEGVDLNHPDLVANLLPGYDGTGLGSNGGPSGNDAHGTACAGIVAAVGNNSTGLAGVAYNCKIIPVRIAYSSGTSWVTSNSTIGTSLDWAWNQGGADVLSNSWGGGSSSSLINDAITRANTQGRGGLGSPVLFAAGNSNGANSYPATLTNVVSVVAMSMCNQRKAPTSCDQETWWGSNFGTGVDVAAPGVKIYTCDISGSAGYTTGNYTASFNGTSSACPNAAGVMALILSVNPGLTVSGARQILESSCDKVGGYTYNTGVSGQPNGSWSTDLGHGRVNAFSALQMANPQPCVSPPPVGVAAVSPSVLCASGTVSLSMTGVNISSGQTYQWQSSPDNSTWTNIVGATNVSASASATASTWYRCLVTCGGGTTPSTSAQVTFNNPTVSSFPHTQNFDGSSSLPCGWSVANSNGDGNTWAMGTLNSRSAPNNVTYAYNATNAANDWLFSAPLQLTAGTSYRVRFWQRVRSATYPENLEVKWGSAASAAGMTSAAIYSGTGLTNTTYAERTGVFTPATSGIYYVGWRAFSNANMYDINIDDVTIDVNPSCTSTPVGGTASGPSVATAGTAASFTVSGSNGSINWQTSSDNGTNWTDVSGATTATVSLNFNPGNFLVRARLSGQGCTDAFSNQVAVTVNPKTGDNINLPIQVASFPFTQSISNAAGSGFSNAYTGANNQASPDIFYRFTTGSCASQIEVSSCGTGFDTYVHLLNVSGTNLASNDDNGVLCTGNAGSLRFSVSPNTTYFAVFEGFGSATGTISVSINQVIVTPSVSITANGPTTFCSGGSVVLTASSGSTYLWNTGATTQSITASSTGSYSVSVTDASGCSGTASQSVTVNTNPSGFTVSGGGSYCSPVSGTSVSLSGSQTGVNYDFRFTAGGSVAVVSGTGSALSVALTSGTGTIFVVATQALTGCSLNMNGSASVIQQIAATWFADSDGDGFGNAASSIQACGNPAGYVSNNTDCNDNSSTAYPGAPEICGNGADDDCDGQVDEGCIVYTWYQDSDNDGFGNTAVSTTTFVNTAPAGFVATGGDCNDGSAAINPSAAEICNGIDDNCDGIVDNGTPALAATGNMSGSVIVCRSTSSNVYSIDPVSGATSYTWTLPTGATGTSTTNSISLGFSSTFAGGSICVTPRNNCVNGFQRCLTVSAVTAKPAQPGVISGVTAGACSTSTRSYSITAVSNASSYNWTAPANSSIVSGQGTSSIVLQFSSGFTSGNLSVTASNCFGTSTARTLALSSTTSTPASISGPLRAVCAGSQQAYSTASISGATVYTWTVPAGAVINSGQGTTSILVTFPTPFTSGAVTVKSGTACFTSAARSITVYSVPVAPTSITGNSVGVCGGSTQTYSCPASTTGATSYNWSVPSGATINSGQGTTSVSVTFPAGFSTGNVSVTAGNLCGNSTARTLAVRSVTTQPGTISGPSANLCGGGTFTYSIAAVAGATSYTWTVPAGCSITANNGTSVTVNISTSFTSGSISVLANNSCGSSTARTLALSRLPATPASISGPASVCPSATGLVYTTPAVSGVSTYSWTLPSGASITAGAGSNSITVNWGTVAGSVSVRAGNSCGINTTARSLSVSLATCRAATEEVFAAAPEVKVHPNPGRGIYFVNVSGLEEGTQLQVMDILGKEVLRKEIHAGENKIDLGEFNSGAYFFRIDGANLHKVLKVIKQ